MNPRLIYVLAGLLNDVNALNWFIERADYPRSILSRNKTVVILTDFIRETYAESNVLLSYSHLVDKVSSKFHIPRKDVEGSPKFAKYLKLFELSAECYDENNDDNFFNQWKSELRCLVEEYTRVQIMKVSRIKYAAMKKECFGQTCKDDSCDCFSQCLESKKQNLRPIDYIQTWSEEIEQKLRCLTKDQKRFTIHDYSDNLEERLLRGEEKFRYRLENPDGTLGLPSSFYTVNRLMDGYCPGRATCYAARTGKGKSVIAKQEALHVYLNSNANVLLINDEMHHTEIEDRMDSELTGESFNKILKGDWETEADFFRYRDKMKERFKERKNTLRIVDASVLTITNMVYLIRTHYNKWGSNFIVILDNLNRMQYPLGKRNEAANAIVIAFHSCIKEFNIPGILIAQLNRDAENETRIQPKHFRDADQIPDHMDAVFALLDYGQQKKKLVVVKGRTFNGDYILLENRLDHMSLVEISDDGRNRLDEDEDEFL